MPLDVDEIAVRCMLKLIKDDKGDSDQTYWAQRAYELADAFVAERERRLAKVTKRAPSAAAGRAQG
jgi:hypothetical protein